VAGLAERLEEEDDEMRRDAPVTPEERQQAIRLIVRFVAAGLAVVIAGGIALLLTRDNDEFDFGGEVTLVDSIGPLSGRDVAAYIFDRERELKEATDVRAAVISLDAYTKEADARKLVEGLNVRALIVAPPGGRPTIVTGDLATWADQARQDAAAERAEFEKLLPTYDAEEEREFLDDAKTQIARLQRVEQAAAPDGDVVFAIVLVAPADELRRLGETTGVRLVDVGTGATVPAMSRVRGIRPEETTTSGDPLTRPA
jgi:hypothetical protein